MLLVLLSILSDNCGKMQCIKYTYIVTCNKVSYRQLHSIYLKLKRKQFISPYDVVINLCIYVIAVYQCYGLHLMGSNGFMNTFDVMLVFALSHIRDDQSINKPINQEDRFHCLPPMVRLTKVWNAICNKNLRGHYSLQSCAASFKSQQKLTMS